MKRNRWVILGLTAIVLLLTAIAVSIFAYNRPLGPSLDLENSGNADQGRLATNLRDSSSTNTSGELGQACGQTGHVNLLILGLPPPEITAHGLDAIRLVVVDYDLHAVRMMAVPRDLWVEVSGLDGVEAATLNDAFGLAEEAFAEGDPDGGIHAIRVVAQALLDNIGYHTDNYLTFDQSAFKKMIDAVGSIEVFVPKTVDGSPEGYGFYEAGLQEMDGQRALDYLRIDRPAGQPPDEWARFRRQNQVIKGIQNEITKSEHWDQIPNLVDDFYDLISTDLSVRELLSFNCMIDAARGNVQMLAVTPDMVKEGPDGALLPDEDAIRKLIGELTEAN